MPKPSHAARNFFRFSYKSAFRTKEEEEEEKTEDLQN
jgi:hypothetical protein